MGVCVIFVHTELLASTARPTPHFEEFSWMGHGSVKQLSKKALNTRPRAVALPVIRLVKNLGSDMNKLSQKSVNVGLVGHSVF